MLNLNDNEKAVVKKVVEHLMESNNIYNGIYDADNGSEDFMLGICMLLDSIAYLVSGEFSDEVDDKFVKNMIKSEKKLLTNSK